eukprot:Awhi_evm1s13152
MAEYDDAPHCGRCQEFQEQLSELMEREDVANTMWFEAETKIETLQQTINALREELEMEVMKTKQAKNESLNLKANLSESQFLLTELQEKYN